MSLIGKILAASLKVVHPAKSETVRYIVDASHEIPELLAQPTKPGNRSKFVDVAVDATELEWIVEVADLSIDGTAFEPSRDHRIEWTKNGQVRTYEVLPRDNMAPFEFRDPDHSQVRIHSKLVEVSDE